MVSLQGKRIGILVEDGFEDDHLLRPLKTLSGAGAGVVLIGARAQAVCRGERERAVVRTDRSVADMRMSDIDALMIPGGRATETMRLNPAMVAIVRAALQQGKIVASIGHGAQLLISGNVLKDRKTTCYPPIAVDVRNAGGECLDQPLVRDFNLITARDKDDIQALTDALIEALGGAREAGAS